jgi:hypothetical protein
MTPTGGRDPGSNTGPPPSPIVVGSWPELLAATGAEDVDDLSALVDGACEADTWVADTDAGVEVGSGVWATCLDFPFAIAVFWALVREVEDEEMARIETTAGVVREVTAGWPLRLIVG